MNFRLTLALSFALIIIVFFFVWEQRHPAEQKAADAMLVFTPAPGDLTSLALLRDNETEVAFSQTDHKWALAVPIKAAVETWTIDGVANAVKGLTYRDKFAPEPTGSRSLDETGLASPHNVIQFVDDKNHAYKLLLGKRTGTTNIYARLDGDSANTIYVLETNPLDQLDKDPSDFRSKDLVDVQTDKVTGVTVSHPDQKVGVVKNAGKWVIQTPIATRANAAAVDDLVSQLKSLHVEQFVPVTRDMPASGLSAPLLSISTISTEVQPFTVAPRGTSATQPTTVPAAPVTSTVTVDFGNPSDFTKKFVYASVNGSSEAVLISMDSYKKLDKTLKDLRDPAITPSPVADAVKIEVSEAMPAVDSHPAKKLTMENTAGQWTVSSESGVSKLPAETAVVTDFLNTLRDLRANKYVDGAGDLKSIGLDPPQRTITLTLPGQTQQEVILIGKPQTAEPLTPVQRQGETTVYLVQTPDLAKLSPTVLDLRSRTIADWKPSDIVDITLSGPAVKFPAKLTRNGAAWKVESEGKTWDIPDAKITALLADLDPLKAEKYTGAALPEPGTTPAADITLDVTDTPPATQPATQPSSQPASQPIAAMGPTLPKTRHIMLYQPKAAAWEATTDVANPSWVFQPTASLITNVTTTDYRPAAATQPTTQSTTQPAATAPATAP